MSYQPAKKGASIFGKFMAFNSGLLVLIAIVEISLRITMPHWDEFTDSRFLTHVFVNKHGPMLIGKPGFSGYFAQNNGDFRVKLNINDAGLRDPLPVNKSNGQIWAFGDSMTFGYGVEDSETYPKLLQTTIKFPVYNFAMPGGDICSFQSMRYRIGDTSQPRAVILGLLIENDIRKYDCAKQFAEKGILNRKNKEVRRNFTCENCLNRLKSKLMEHSAFYNFVALNVKRIPLLEYFFKKMGLIAQEHQKPVLPSTENIEKLTGSTVSEILRLRNHFPTETPLVVLLIPARHDLRDGDVFYKNIRKLLGRNLEARKINYIDPYFYLQQAGFKKIHFHHDGHWTRVGHEIAAKMLAEWFKVNNILAQ